MSNMTRPVVATTLQGKKVFFPSMSLAAQCLSLSSGSIHSGIKRGIKIGGWGWEYHDENSDYTFSPLTPELMAEMFKPRTPRKFLDKQEEKPKPKPKPKPARMELRKEARLTMEREESERESLKEVPGAVYRYGYFLEGMGPCVCPGCQMYISTRRTAHIESCCEGKELKRLPGGVLRLRIK